MTVKFALLAAALVPMLASGTYPLDPPTIGNNDARVAKVACVTGYGTAFRVAKDYWISVRHVTANGGCSVDGEPIKDLWEDRRRDFAIFFLAPRKGKSMSIDCEGFKAGRKYVAIGHARALDEQTRITTVATGNKWGDFAELRGVWTVIPGQSGGPIIDKETGKVVGTVNNYNPRGGESGSIPLGDTSVCADA